MFDLFSYKLGMIQGQNDPSPESPPALYPLTITNNSNYQIKISFFRQGVHYTASVSSGTTTFQLDKYGIFAIWAQNIDTDEHIFIDSNQNYIISGNDIYVFYPYVEDAGTMKITDGLPK